MGERERKLEALGYLINDVPDPAALYRPIVVHGNTLYVSGAIPVTRGQLTTRGRVPSEVSMEEAKASAALCAANGLRFVIQELGSLDKVMRVVRVTGYVNADPEFESAHLVINGASELLQEVFGDAGVGARSALGTVQLPLGASTEVEIILELM